MNVAETLSFIVLPTLLISVAFTWLRGPWRWPSPPPSLNTTDRLTRLRHFADHKTTPYLADRFIAVDDIRWAVDEIERLDADACSERAERESWQAIAATRDVEIDRQRGEIRRLEELAVLYRDKIDRLRSGMHV